MILCIPEVLTSQELELIQTKLHDAEFVDGKTTAGWHARLVKHNTQAQKEDPAAQEVRKLLVSALKRNEVFQMAVRPRAMRPPLLSRYEVGMSYGTHVDNALMGDGDYMRSDVSLTMFLNSPSAYEGGELVIEDTQGIQPFKLDAGMMIVYPSTTLHRVEPVTAGSRLVAVTWVQSMIRDAAEREILFDLDTARQAIFKKHGKTPEFDLLSKTHANLLRKWVEL